MTDAPSTARTVAALEARRKRTATKLTTVAEAIDQMLKARALNAEDALKTARHEIRAQRDHIGELLGQVRDLTTHWTEQDLIRIVDDNNHLKKQVRQLTSENNDLKNKLSAARETHGLPTNGSPCSKPSTRPPPSDGSWMERERPTTPGCRPTPSGAETGTPDSTGLGRLALRPTVATGSVATVRLLTHCHRARRALRPDSGQLRKRADSGISLRLDQPDVGYSSSCASSRRLIQHPRRRLRSTADVTMGLWELTGEACRTGDRP